MAASPGRERLSMAVATRERVEVSFDEDEEYLAEIEEFAEALPDKFLQCRELMHNWGASTASINKRTKAIYRVLRCSRCRSRKFQDLTPRGKVVRSYIVYQDGFLHQ